ncbi:MAG TPA: YgiT-type zinc finger protein [Thermoanaerobaculia bacterium]|nr:YgiT-type zinc finger protein [Thermoanaerobaculia bacterium]
MARTAGQRLSLATPAEATTPLRSGPLGVVPPVSYDLDATVPIGQGAHQQLGAETLPMRCLRCQGTVERGTAPVQVERDGYKLAWEQVPAWVCKRCEVAYFEPHEVETIRRALSAMRALSQV